MMPLILLCFVFFLSVFSLYLSIRTRSEEFELFGIKYGQKTKKSKIVAHGFCNMIAIISFVGYLGGMVAYLIYNWDKIEKHFLYIVVFICSIVAYFLLFGAIDNKFLNARDVHFNKEIRSILDNNALYQAIINKAKTNNYQSVYIASDGVAFFNDTITSVKYPEKEVEVDWMKSYQQKYIDVGKNSIIAATKRRCKEWEKTMEEKYFSVHSCGCNDFLLFADYGSKGISSMAVSDFHRYLCKDLDYKQETVTISQPFLSYYTESYGGRGTIVGSTISYTPSGTVKKKTEHTGCYNFTVLVAKND